MFIIIALLKSHQVSFLAVLEEKEEHNNLIPTSWKINGTQLVLMELRRSLFFSISQNRCRVCLILDHFQKF